MLHHIVGRIVALVPCRNNCSSGVDRKCEQLQLQDARAPYVGPEGIGVKWEEAGRRGRTKRQDKEAGQSGVVKVRLAKCRGSDGRSEKGTDLASAANPPRAAMRKSELMGVLIVVLLREYRLWEWRM